MKRIYRKRYRALMRAKLGLTQEDAGDDQLIGDLLTLMAKARADYTLSFRNLSGDDAAWLALFGDHERRRRSLAVALSRADGKAKTCPAWTAINPKYVLRNWVAETAIRAVEDRGDLATLDRIFRLIQSPFETHDGDEAFAAPPPPELCGLEVSCSS